MCAQRQGECFVKPALPIVNPVEIDEIVAFRLVRRNVPAGGDRKNFNDPRATVCALVDNADLSMSDKSRVVQAALKRNPPAVFIVNDLRIQTPFRLKPVESNLYIRRCQRKIRLALQVNQTRVATMGRPVHRNCEATRQTRSNGRGCGIAPSGRSIMVTDPQ